MKAWWEQLQPRQRLLLIIAAGVIGAVLVYTQVWEPLDGAREQQRNRVAQQQALADWLEAVTPVAEQLRREGSQLDESLADRSLLGRVDETARAAGLAGAVQRIEPGSDDQVRVWMDDAPFPVLMEWLTTLAAEQGIRVEQMTADRADEAGSANVRLTLTEGA